MSYIPNSTDHYYWHSGRGRLIPYSIKKDDGIYAQVVDPGRHEEDWKVMDESPIAFNSDEEAFEAAKNFMDCGEWEQE